ncbi:hypothetical protein K1719_012957 [Acacia pycnantha]|nr:hypothetical protein K1719_012957 [Acacia pycnantha]
MRSLAISVLFAPTRAISVPAPTRAVPAPRRYFSFPSLHSRFHSHLTSIPPLLLYGSSNAVLVTSLRPQSVEGRRGVLWWWERSLYSPHKHAYGATSRSPSFGPAPGSILDSLLVRTEHLRALSGFYCLPDDMPFNPHALPKSTDALIPPPVRPVRSSGSERAKINMTGSIWWRYLNIITQLVAPKGGDDDDGLLAHCLSCDIKCLQAISRRVHFSKFIAEGKF